MRRAIGIALVLIAVAAVVLIPSATGADDGPYRVRAIFDNGGFIVPGEEVRIAGATVGTVESVDVSGEDEIVSFEGGDPQAVPGKAVVVLDITDDAFKDFREDASCIIRPQSLIGEKLVDCTPTQPRAPGQDPPPELPQIESGPGEGERLLPLENNGKSVDIDLIQNINRAPYRDRFRLILNDLGAGLAARGDDLGAVIDRANPALRQTNRVLKILADQSDQLDSLATDSDVVLQQLADHRTDITGFFANAAVAGQATAERSSDLEAQLELFPETLREVRKTMVDLKGFADQGTPLMRDIGASAPYLSKATQNLPAFFKAGTPALTTLGDAGEQAGPDLVAADPVVVQTRDLTQKAGPASQSLSDLLSTFEDTDGFKHLMDFIYNSVGSINGYDQYGHFLRALGIRSSCLDVKSEIVSACAAFFEDGANASGAGASASKSKKEEPQARSEAIPVPPLDELIPELDPSEEQPDPEEEPQPPPTTTTDGDPASPPSSEDQQQDQQNQAVTGRSATGRTGRMPSFQDASMLLDFLLGGTR